MKFLIDKINNYTEIKFLHDNSTLYIKIEMNKLKTKC